MDFYQEVTLLPQLEIPVYFLWSKVYTQLHLAFVEQKDNHESIPFGVSFPNYRSGENINSGFLGIKIRIFAKNEALLEKLNLGHWLEQLIDYVHITPPRAVPKEKITGYALFYRVNPKPNLEQRIAHQARRRNISIEEASLAFKNFIALPNVEPYIVLKSLSAKREENIDRPYRLYIGKSLADKAKDGKFGTYGLSRMATVPEF